MKERNTGTVGFEREITVDPCGLQAKPHRGTGLQSPQKEGQARRVERREVSPGVDAGRVGGCVRMNDSQQGNWPRQREHVGGTEECMGQLTEGPDFQVEELASQWEAARGSV